jgi:hypothetical protein
MYGYAHTPGGTHHRLRYGLEINQPVYFRRSCNKFGWSRERIRQIEGKALKRLRHPYRSRQLREYFLIDNNDFLVNLDKFKSPL